ncbi:unnamed protein product, partial [Heterosigma akashiwo]
GGEKKASTFEVRKAARAARAAGLRRLAEARPAADAEDAQDVAAVRHAEANMGDFKLKSAADYEVPEEERVNAEKKRRQMLLLEESVAAVRARFNGR